MVVAVIVMVVAMSVVMAVIVVMSASARGVMRVLRRPRGIARRKVAPERRQRPEAPIDHLPAKVLHLGRGVSCEDSETAAEPLFRLDELSEQHERGAFIRKNCCAQRLDCAMWDFSDKPRD